MSDPATLAYYEREAPVYSASTAENEHRHLDPFLALLPDRAHILELGCGAGSDARRMMDAGFTVDATDGAEAMVRQANAQFDIYARTMRFDQLDAFSQYDAVWAHASLLHAFRADLPAILAAIFIALKPDGWHFASYKLSDAAHPDETRDKLGRWANLPSEDWLESAYRAAGFTIEETDRYAGNGSDGVQRDWLALTVGKCV